MSRPWWILTASRLRETWNHRLRFGRSGIWFILLELSAPAALIWLGVTLLKKSAYPIQPGIFGFLLAMNLLACFGNSYIRAERALFSNEALLDRILGQPGEVVLSAIAVGYLDNLRPAMQSPLLLALIMAYHRFPGCALLLGGLFFILPLFCVALSVPAAILVQRLSGGISALFSIVAALITLSGLAGAVWLVIGLARGELPDAALFSRQGAAPAGWWLYFFFLAGVSAVFLSRKLSYLWEEALLLQEERSIVRLKREQGRQLIGFLSALRLPPAVQGIIFKEWQSLRRNPITKFRFVVWFILSLIPVLHPGLRSLILSLPSLLPVIFVIWVFCFGEMIATTYQSEADRLGILWLAAIRPGQLALGKFLAYLPLVLFAGGSAGIIIFPSAWDGARALLLFLFTILGTISSMALGLIPAAFSMNRVSYHSNSLFEMTLEQVPVTLPGILSAALTIGFLAGFCYLSIRVQSNMTALAAPAALFAGCMFLTVLSISITGYLVQRYYSL